MDALEYMEARREIRAELARRLRWGEVPDAVWARVDDLGLVLDVALHRDEDSWSELMDVARKERAALSDRISSGRGEERAAPQEIDIRLEDLTRRRSEVFSEVAAALAEQRRDVRKFRRSYLRYGPRPKELVKELATELTTEEAAALRLSGRYEEGGLLTAEEADAFLAGRETGRRTLDWRTTARSKLRRLAGTLSRSYGWRERDAEWFVLTGQQPVYRPVRVAVAFTESRREEVPNTARIITESEVWVEKAEVEGARTAARRQILGGDRTRRRIDDRSLEVVRFVTRQIREHGPDLPWPELQRRWNRAAPEGWQYSDRNGLWRAYKRSHERLWRPKYKRPKWKRRDDWEGGHTGEG